MIGEVRVRQKCEEEKVSGLRIMGKSQQQLIRLKRGMSRKDGRVRIRWLNNLNNEGMDGWMDG